MASKYGTNVNGGWKSRRHPEFDQSGAIGRRDNPAVVYYDLGTIEARSNGSSGSRTNAGFLACRRSNSMRRSK